MCDVTDQRQKIIVRLLEWEDGQYGRLYAKTPFCQYSVRDFGGGNFWADRNGTLLYPSHSTLDAAKAAAQADYENRALSSVYLR